MGIRHQQTQDTVLQKSAPAAFLDSAECQHQQLTSHIDLEIWQAILPTKPVSTCFNQDQPLQLQTPKFSNLR